MAIFARFIKLNNFRVAMRWFIFFSGYKLSSDIRFDCWQSLNAAMHTLAMFLVEFECHLIWDDIFRKTAKYYLYRKGTVKWMFFDRTRVSKHSMVARRLHTAYKLVHY